MKGLYIGSTAGYSGKNMLVLGLGLRFLDEGLRVGYMKPVGVAPLWVEESVCDEDSCFISEALGLDQDPELTTPVVLTRDMKMEAFTSGCAGKLQAIVEAYENLSANKDVMLVGGSGSFLYSGTACGVSGPRAAESLDVKVLLVDRFKVEVNYDYLLSARELLGDRLAGCVLNDVPEHFMDEAIELVRPFLERNDVRVLGVAPSDPVMRAITVGDLAQRLGGKVISASTQADRLVENFLIGTMQVENFLTHFQKHKRSAIIVGGDRSDLQLAAMEGGSPCLILTGNLYPNDIILTRSEVLNIPVIIVREDTFSVAKKMEQVLETKKIRSSVKIQRGRELVAQHVDFAAAREIFGV